MGAAVLACRKRPLAFFDKLKSASETEADFLSCKQTCKPGSVI